MRTRLSILLGLGVGTLAAVTVVNPADSAPKRKAKTSWFLPGECRATDGDTVRCGDERIRMIEIDAPELKGHCRKGRVCVPGDGPGSGAALNAVVSTSRVKLVRYGTDGYGRTLGDLRVGGRSASCLQIRGGYAIQQLKWKNYGVTQRECPVR